MFWAKRFVFSPDDLTGYKDIVDQVKEGITFNKILKGGPVKTALSLAKLAAVGISCLRYLYLKIPFPGSDSPTYSTEYSNESIYPSTSTKLSLPRIKEMCEKNSSQETSIINLYPNYENCTDKNEPILEASENVLWMLDEMPEMNEIDIDSDSEFVLLPLDPPYRLVVNARKDYGYDKGQFSKGEIILREEGTNSRSSSSCEQPNPSGNSIKSGLRSGWANNRSRSKGNVKKITSQEFSIPNIKYTFRNELKWKSINMPESELYDIEKKIISTFRTKYSQNYSSISTIKSSSINSTRNQTSTATQSRTASNNSQRSDSSNDGQPPENDNGNKSDSCRPWLYLFLILFSLCAMRCIICMIASVFACVFNVSNYWIYYEILYWIYIVLYYSPFYEIYSILGSLMYYGYYYIAKPLGFAFTACTLFHALRRFRR